MCGAEAKCQRLDDKNYLFRCEQSAGSAYIISNLAITKLGKISLVAKQVWSEVAHQTHGDAEIPWVRLDEKRGVVCEVKKKNFFSQPTNSNH